MTLVNEISGKGVNTTAVFSVTITDTNEHDLPDINGDDSVGGDPYSVETIDKTIVKIVNNADQSATVRIEGASFEDPGITQPNPVQSGISIASGGHEWVTISSDEPYAYLRVVVSYSTAPTSGDTKVVFQTDD